MTTETTALAEQSSAPDPIPEELLKGVINTTARWSIAELYEDILTMDTPTQSDFEETAEYLVSAEKMDRGACNPDVPWSARTVIYNTFEDKFGNKAARKLNRFVRARSTELKVIVGGDKSGKTATKDTGKTLHAPTKPKSNGMRDKVFDKIDAKAAKFTPRTKEADIDEAVKALIKYGLDANSEEYLIDQMVTHTSLRRVKARKKVQALIAENKKTSAPTMAEKQAKITTKTPPVVNRDDLSDRLTYAILCIEEANAKEARILEYNDTLVRVEAGGKIRELNQLRFEAELNEITEWQRVAQVGDTEVYTKVTAPDDVVRKLFNSERTIFPKMTGMTLTPTFDKDGNLIDEHGLHHSGLFYYDDGSLKLPSVSRTPTDDEVIRAKEIIDAPFADFPFDGMCPEAVARGESPSKANATGLMILPFMRPMIHGPTP